MITDEELLFETYWSAQKEKFSNMPGVMELAFKEIAEKAWNAGVDAGYIYGCER